MFSLKKKEKKKRFPESFQKWQLDGSFVKISTDFLIYFQGQVVAFTPDFADFITRVEKIQHFN